METMYKARVRIIRIPGIFTVCLSMLMTIIRTYQIITCYFFSEPSTASEELLTYSFAWMALLTSAYMFGKRDHMRMGFPADKISGSVKKYLEVTIDLLTFAFAGVVMVYGSIPITKLTMIQATASPRVPIEYIYAVVPAAGIAVVMLSLMNVVDMLHTDFGKREDAGVWMWRQSTG